LVGCLVSRTSVQHATLSCPSRS
jgi:hypothetical protein